MSEESGGGEESHDGDGVQQFVDRHPEAAELLGQLTHPGGKLGTVTTLRMRFLYVNGEGMPDPSVNGLPLEQRIDLVGAAIVEGIGKGWREWAPRALAGFIRRLRETPAPVLPGEREAEAAEIARDQQRRDAAKNQAIQDRLNQEAEVQQKPWHEAQAWRDEQPPEVQKRLDELAAKVIQESGYSGRKPPLFIRGPAMARAVARLRDEQAGAV